MPIYQYHDLSTGQIVELLRPVAERDLVPSHLQRITVPERLGVHGSLAPLDPHTADSSVPRAFRELELTMGHSELVKKVGFSRDHIRRVWNFLLIAALLLGTLYPGKAQDISKGYAFTPTEQVTSTKLNNLVDLATINASFVSGKSAITSPLEGDSFVLYSTALLGLRKCTLGTLIPVLFVDRSAASNLVSSFFQGDVDPSNILYSASALTLSNFLNNVDANGGSNFLNNVSQGGVSNLFNKAIPQVAGGSNFLAGVVKGLVTDTNAATNSVVVPIWDPASNALLSVTLDGLLFTNLANVTNFDFSSRMPIRTSGGQLASTAVSNIAQVLYTNRTITGVALTGSPPAQITSQSHGLPGVPQLARWVIVCTNAELNYSVGDEVGIEGVSRANADFEACLVPGANATTVWLVQSDNVAIPNKTTGAFTAITAVKWNAKAYLTYWYH